MNLVEALLAADNEKLVNDRTESYEVKRLSEKLGQPFVLTLKAIPSRRYTEIQTAAVKFNKDNTQSIDLYKLQTMTLAAGIASPKLGDTELLRKFNAVTPVELLDKLLLAGEISSIADRISKLSGFEDNEKKSEEVKN